MKVKTRDGGSALIIYMERKGTHPIVALVGSAQQVQCYRSDGKLSDTNSSMDLMLPQDKQYA